MRALVIGDEGSTHPLCWRLSQSPAVGDLYAAPGNYGTNLVGANVSFAVHDVDAMAAWAVERGVDLVVVASATAAYYGAVDVCRDLGLRVVGAERATALLETSRSHFFEMARRAEVPVVEHVICRNQEDLDRGLPVQSASTSSILVTIEDPQGVPLHDELVPDAHAIPAVVQAFVDRARRSTEIVVTLEQYPDVPHYALTFLSDGKDLLFVGSATCYRRAFAGETGPVVQGMGATSPVGTEQGLVETVSARVVKPLIARLAADGRPLLSPLTVEVSGEGSRLALHGVQFTLGATESHVLLPRWEDDLYIVLDAIADRALSELRPFRWNNQVTCGVMVASEGYPGAVETGYGVLGLGDAPGGALIFHVGTRSPQRRGNEIVQSKIERTDRSFGRGFSSWLMPSRGRARKVDAEAGRRSGDPYSQVITAGGLVVCAVGRGRNPADARAVAYRGADAVSFTGRWWREDIGGADSV